jgi:Uma2 family endonuclease
LYVVGYGKGAEYARDVYTYADYLEWDEKLRAEIIDGKFSALAAPDLEHQRIIRELFGQFYNLLREKPCEVFVAPISVRLNPAPDNSDKTVVEPDIALVCDPAKLDKRSVNGAPGLVIEVLSPSTARHDKLVKFHKYREAGVREYWLADPDAQIVQVCILTDGRYKMSVYGEADDIDNTILPVSVLPGCKIDLKDVFSGNYSKE